MSLWKRLTTAANFVVKGTLGDTQTPSSGLTSLFGGVDTASGMQVSDASAMRVAAVYACVRVIAEDIAKLPIGIWREMPDQSREVAREHPLHAILRRPNRHMTRVSFMLAMGASYALRGNAVAVILRDGRGRPVGLWPLHPGSVCIHEAIDGSLFYAVSRRSTLETAILAQKPLMIPDYDILHVRGLTFDGIVGLSPLAQSREDIGIALAGQRMSGRMMKNGAQVGGVLKHPGKLTDMGVIERLRASWAQRNAGVDNAGGTVILEEGMSFEKLGMTSVDAEFLDQRTFTIAEIARAFRVPLHMIQHHETTAGNNTQQEARRNYYDQTLMPALQAFEEEFGRAFNLVEDVYVEFDEKGLLRADFKTRQEGNRTMFQSGALMPNEWRIDEGLRPSRAGRVFARPLNTAYVDEEGNVVSVTPAGGADPVLSGEKETPDGDISGR